MNLIDRDKLIEELKELIGEERTLGDVIWNRAIHSCLDVVSNQPLPKPYEE